MASTRNGSGIFRLAAAVRLAIPLALVALVSGSAARPLAAPAPVPSPGGMREPAWSADGKRIAVSYLDRVWTAAPDGKLAKPLTTGSAVGIEREPAWSPDGRTIAFSADAGQGFHVYTAPATGGAPARVTTLVGQERWPSWTRDGRLVFASRDEPAQKVAGDSHSSLLAQWDLFIVSPEQTGAALAATKGGRAQSGTAAATIAWGPPVRLTTTPDNETGPRVSPDGTRILYLSDRDNEDLDVDLWVMQVPQAAPETKQPAAQQQNPED